MNKYTEEKKQGKEKAYSITDLTPSGACAPSVYIYNIKKKFLPTSSTTTGSYYYKLLREKKERNED